MMAGNEIFVILTIAREPFVGADGLELTEKSNLYVGGMLLQNAPVRSATN
jgi:hypothetical protein